MNSLLKLFPAPKISCLSISRPLTYAYLTSKLSVWKHDVDYAKEYTTLSQHRSEKARAAEYSTLNLVQSVQNAAQFRHNSSSLFVSDVDLNASSDFQFNHDLVDRLDNLEELKSNLHLRGLNIDVDQLMRDYKVFVELEKEKQRLETRREEIARHIAAIVAHLKENKTKSKEAAAKMKSLIEEGKATKMTLKDLMMKYWVVEEKVMICALALPSRLSHDIPERPEVLKEYFQGRKPESPLDHYECLRKSKCVRLSNVGHKAYYLTGRLAVLEQELINRFSSQIRSYNLTQMAAPEMIKTPVMEANGLDVVDPASLYRLHHKQGTSRVSDWDKEHMFLHGASQHSFSSYFARMLIDGDDLPIRMFVVGRNYIPENTQSKSLPGLLGVLQSVKVCMCGISKSGESSTKHMEEFTAILTDLYKQFELPFRLVSLPASSLSLAEQNRTELQLWVPSLQLYLKLASISMYGDYNSRRLMMRCGDNHKPASSHPTFMVCSEVTDITRMVALLLEYGQTDRHWGTRQS